jgi:hypothetical protein
MGCGHSSAKEPSNPISTPLSNGKDGIQKERISSSSSNANAVKGTLTVNSRKQPNTLQLQTVIEASDKPEEDAAFKKTEVVAGRRLSQSHNHIHRTQSRQKNTETAASSTYHSSSSINSHNTGNSSEKVRNCA